MKKKIIAIIVVFLMLLLFSIAGYADHIEKDKVRWKEFYKNTAPRRDAVQWLVPFKTADRKNVNTVRVVSVFGAKRMSYVRGHFHTGVDLIPRRKRGDVQKYTDVYVMADGVVCSIHLGAPHTTVVVKHKLLDGTFIFSSYKHLWEIYLENGQQVTSSSRVGRLYTRAEARKLGGNYDHLHLEIRKRFDDYGVASWATMTDEALKLRFQDPMKFMKIRVK
jgi:murein DD-endopeptidase MepM/ murein hydrolase activator NlpD